MEEEEEEKEKGGRGGGGRRREGEEEKEEEGGGRRGGLRDTHAALGSGLLEVGDDVVAVLLFLEAGEHHLSAGDVLGGVGEVGVEVLLAPHDSGALVGVGVIEALGLSRQAAEEAVQVRALLVRSSSLHGVALGALLLEQLSSLGGGHGELKSL